MKYLIDLTSLSEKNTGIEKVAENAACSFIKTYSKNDYYLVFNWDIPKVFNGILKQANVEYIKLKSKSFNKLRILNLPKAIKKANADINLFFAFPCPYFASHKNSVSLIHDLTAFKYPETQTKLQSFRWKKMINKCIKKDKHILTVSDVIKYEIADKFQRCDAKRIYPGVNISKNADDSVLEKFKLEKNNYILSVATLEPRKNITFLIRAYKDLISNKCIDQKLVLVGKAGWNFDKNLFENENIIFTDYVSDMQLRSLYNNASLFVSTSIYEGFGLPVIEAIKCDCPTLLSNIDTYKEITSNNGNYFDLSNIEDLKQKICLLVYEKKSKQKIDYSKYSWNIFTQNLNKFLNDKNKLLFVHSNNFTIMNGATVRTFQNLLYCKKNYNCDEYYITHNSNYVICNLKDVIKYIRYKSCQLSLKSQRYLMRVLRSGLYEFVFIDNSLYGNLEKIIKKKFPDVKVITHFHNYEFKFWNDNFESKNITKINIFSNLSLRMINKSENISANYADKLVFISNTDEENIVAKHNINNKKCSVVAPQIFDKYKTYEKFNNENNYVLFFGSNFYANVEAAKFLIEEIAPFVNKKIIICGEGLDKCFSKKYNNVKIIGDGSVLDKYLYNSLAVAFPVFLGSGSKIKTAHSLMFGKYIIGTNEVFIGYDVANAKVKVCCNSEEFIDAINNCGSKQKFWKENRQLYLDKYMLKD